MKKYLIPIIASFFIISTAYAFKPATLFIETWEGIKKQAVWTQEQAKELFNQGYELDTGMLGSSIVEIQGTDTLKDSRTTINNNFTALNAGKIENTTTSLPLLSTLANLSTVGTITTGVWNGTAIAVNKGGTGTTSPSRYLVPIGNGDSGYTHASSTGTTGQFLTSNGVSAYPSWQTSTVNQNDDYNWTGEHNWSATTTFTSLTSASTTFTSIPTMPITAPTLGQQVANKQYVDDKRSYLLKYGHTQTTVAMTTHGTTYTIREFNNFGTMAANDMLIIKGHMTTDSTSGDVTYYVNIGDGTATTTLTFAVGTNYGGQMFEIKIINRNSVSAQSISYLVYRGNAIVFNSIHQTGTINTSSNLHFQIRVVNSAQDVLTGTSEYTNIQIIKP